MPPFCHIRKLEEGRMHKHLTWTDRYPREILGFETSGSLFERYVAEAA